MPSRSIKVLRQILDSRLDIKVAGDRLSISVPYEYDYQKCPRQKGDQAA